MGTRGFVGFVVDGTEKIAYNHFDSYPSGLGTDVLGWLRKAHLGSARRLAGELRVVDPESEPTDADIEALAGYLNKNVGSPRPRPDWYQLLRETQGNPAAILDAGVLLDAHEFPLDSLFAEWGYVVDFDAQVFEAYQGFQHAPHDRGRFADRQTTSERRSPGYHPCALVASWPLDALPSDSEFLKALKDDDGEADR